jgi:hypothetical protein
MTNLEELRNPDTLYVRLEKDSALDIIRKIESPTHSDLPVVRAIVDKKLGFAVLPKVLPADLKEASILAFQRPEANFASIAHILSRTPGVLRVTTNFAEAAL